MENDEGVEASHVMWLTRIAWERSGVHPGQIDRNMLDELLFEATPKKMSIEPDRATAVVASVAHFVRFLDDVRLLEDASECLELLNDNTVERLESALADRHNWGMAKTMVMEGIRAGYDMSDPEDWATAEAQERQQGQKEESSLSYQLIPETLRIASS